MNETIAILLATYNGAPFLAGQLQSLADQTDTSFVVLVRDDGSSDATLAILSDYARRFPGRFETVECATARAGALGSFSALLQTAVADPRHFGYFMFCDQDDIWLPEKVARLRALVRSRGYRSETPRLAHSDMVVVAPDLAPLARSFWRSQGLDIRNSRLDRLLMQNTVTGHACIFNRQLAELALPIPPDALMHDWWMALTAAALGEILTLDTPLSLYRQHGGNTLGCSPERRKLSRFLSVRHWRNKILKRGTIHAAIFRQADVFLDRFSDRLQPGERTRMERLRGVSRSGFWSRRWKLLRSGAFPRCPVDFIDLMLKG